VNDEERLEEIEKVLDELREMSEDRIILAEGLKDKKALRSIGIAGEVFLIQSEGGPMRAAEYVAESKKKAIILTDWDHKGGTIAKELERQLSSLGLEYDSDIRAKLSFLCKKYIKDLESLGTMLERLTANTSGIKCGHDTVVERGPLVGAFLVIEGIDGAGKSTLCKAICKRLSDEGYDVMITQEPTHDEIGSFIREKKVKDISQKAEALLFVADRAVHTERILKWKAEGRIVICDRYFASTVAYQSSELNKEVLDREWLIALNMPVIATPDLTVLLDIDPEKGLSRIGERGELSKFEESKFLSSVRREYLRLADEFDFMIVDAEEKQSDIAKMIIAKLKEKL
jgi:dTMP kinase